MYWVQKFRFFDVKPHCMLAYGIVRKYASDYPTYGYDTMFVFSQY